MVYLHFGFYFLDKLSGSKLFGCHVYKITELVVVIISSFVEVLTNNYNRCIVPKSVEVSTVFEIVFTTPPFAP